MSRGYGRRAGAARPPGHEPGAVRAAARTDPHPAGGWRQRHRPDRADGAKGVVRGSRWRQPPARAAAGSAEGRERQAREATAGSAGHAPQRQQRSSTRRNRAAPTHDNCLTRRYVPCEAADSLSPRAPPGPAERREAGDDRATLARRRPARTRPELRRRTPTGTGRSSCATRPARASHRRRRRAGRPHRRSVRAGPRGQRGGQVPTPVDAPVDAPRAAPVPAAAADQLTGQPATAQSAGASWPRVIRLRR